MKRVGWLAVAAAFWVAAGCGTSHAAEGPPPAEPPKAEEAREPAPEVLEVLDRMDEAGRKIETLTSRFDYELNQTLFEDVQKREGRLSFKAPNLLRFEFTSAPKEAFVFDGRMLYHRKDATKQLILWEVRLPEEPAVESFELGKTPFPMPFGQRKETVLKHFDVARDRKAEEADKAGRAVLALTPKKGTPLAQEYTKVALWVDPQSHLPTRARLWDPSENITTVDFHHIEVNKKVDAKTFERPSVPSGWEIVTHAKEGPTAAPGKP